MVKHIIMLALFIMFYIIGNAMALTPAERKAQFENVVVCYRQFYNFGLMTRNTAVLGPLPYGTEETFDSILEAFYRNISAKGDNADMEYVMSIIDFSFNNEENFLLFKEQFYNDIRQLPDFDITLRRFKFDIGARNRQFPSPFDKFVNNHILVPGRLDYYETASKFCDHYSKGLPLETNWARSFNY